MLCNHVRYLGSTTAVPEGVIKEARAVAALFAIAIDALFKEVSKSKGFTEPKSWTAKATAAKTTKKPRGQCHCSVDEIAAGAERHALGANRDSCSKSCKAIGTDAQCGDCRFAKGAGE